MVGDPGLADKLKRWDEVYKGTHKLSLGRYKATLVCKTGKSTIRLFLAEKTVSTGISGKQIEVKSTLLETFLSYVKPVELKHSHITKNI